MNKTMRKLIILMLAFFLMFPLTPLANVPDDELRDIRGHWAQQAISSMFEKDLVRGYGDGTFRPDASISRIEFVILVNRIFGFTATTDVPFTDVDESYPFYPDVVKAFAIGYIKGYPDGTFRVDQPITREEAAVILATAFKLEPSEEPVTTLSDVESLADWSKKAVRALVHAGYLTGYPDGTFRGRATISRAETVKLLSEIAGEVLNQPGVYEGLNVRNAVINRSGIVLKNSVIEGDLYLTEGIGEGDVTLDHVTVRGTVHIEGGGPNSIHVIDSTIASIVVDKQTGTVRIAVEGASNIEQVFVITGVKIEVTDDESEARVEKIVLDERMIEDAMVELSGTFGTVEVRALTEPELKLLKGIIEHLIADQKVKLHVDADGKIDDLLNNTEDEITVTGDGEISVNPDSKGKVDGGLQPAPSVPVNPIAPIRPTGPTFQNVSVHDPSIIVADGQYYVFGTHIEAARSQDLMRWTRFTNGYTTPDNALFGDLSANLAGSFAWAGENDADSHGGYSVWAPDVIWVDEFDNGDGTTGAYLMYYSVSSTYIRSAIGVAASKNIEGPYEYVDTIVYSGFTPVDAYDDRSTVNKIWTNTHLDELIEQKVISGVNDAWFNGNAYNNSLFPNAIDPALFYDEHGRLWMSYGSWSGGIFLLEIDPTTGLPIYPGVDGETEDKRMIDRYFGIKIAGGYTKSGEGPYIVYDPTTGYYYLYVTYGWLGADGEYNMRLFRAENPEGPYLDAAGQNAVLPGNVNNSPYGNKLIGHFTVPRLAGEPGAIDSWGYVSPGHNSAYRDPMTGEHYLIFHTRFPNRGEAHEVRVHQMFMNEDNWLVVSPYRYAGERLEPVSEDSIAGEYKYLNHGKENTKQMNYPTYITLHEDHTITSGTTGETIGTWSLNGDYYAVITVDEHVYKGVFVRGWDPILQQFTLTFTALSDQGENIWGMRFSDIVSAEDAVAVVAAGLELGVTTDLTWNLQLPASGAYGATIEWTSSDESVITKDGVITRPDVGEPAAAAILTATITRGGARSTKTFNITIKQRIAAELAARYTFDGDLQDSMNNYSAGTVTGDRITNTGGQITYSDGVIDQAAVFDGASGIRLPNGLIHGYEYSVALWLKPDQLTRFTTSFFGARDLDNWISLNPHGWSDTAMLWSGTDWYDALSDVTLPIGEWTHLAFVVDNGEVYLYVNGEQKFSGIGFPHIFNVDNAEFALGVNHWDLPYKGLMDDLRIYTGVLTEEEVASLITEPAKQVERIVLDVTERILYLEETFRPDVRVYPIFAGNRNVMWSSSDDSVASVDPVTGEVAALSPGIAEIKATALDGSGVSASYIVHVKEGLPLPVAYLAFEGDLKDEIAGWTGTTTSDRPTNPGGSITYAEGTIGQAAVFDGQSGVRLPDGLITGNQYSIVMSLYLEEGSQHTTTFFGARDHDHWISFVPRGPGDARNTMLWSGSQPYYDATTNMQIPLKTWTEVAFTVNNGHVIVYIDGQPKFNGDGFPDIFTTDDAVFTLGVNYWDAPFKGMIDELRIYDRALRHDQIESIIADPNVNVETILFELDEKTILVGDSYTPSVTVLPARAGNKSLSWSTSDDQVAIVNAVTGEVIGVGNGTATITATAQDGSGVSASYIVHVREGTPEPVAYYNFDGHLGDSLSDKVATVTGDRADNTGGNISFADGVNNLAAVFDGTSGIRLPNGLISGYEYTVTMSVYMDADDITEYDFSSAFFGATAHNHWISFTPIGHPEEVNRNSTLWSDSLGVYFIPNTGMQIANRTWVDIAFTVDHGKIMIYIDGEIRYIGDNFPDVFTTEDAVFALGVNYWNHPFKGMIDELRVYDRALDEGMIDLIFLESRMPKPTAHFTFDDHLVDAVDSARGGTVIGVERNAADNGFDFGIEFGNGEITFDSGVRGHAAVFNGESGMFLPGGLIQSDRYTVSMWLNPDQLTAFTPTFFTALDGYNWISFIPSGHGGQTMLRSYEVSGNWYDGMTGMTIPVSEWTHIAFTVDGSHVKIYINGELKLESLASPIPDIFTGKTPFYTLGVNWWDTPYKGKIDELRIYDIPLQDEDIMVLYNLRK